MVLLQSSDLGQTFKTLGTDPWNANVCVMSTESIASAGTGPNCSTIAAWETRGQICFQRLGDPQSTVQNVPGHADRKHPAVAMNAAGDFVIVWAEGTGWNKGGRIAWQVFDHTGRPTRAGAANDLPVWSQPTAYAKADGSFGVIY